MIQFYTLALCVLTLAAYQTHEPSYTISGTITEDAKDITMVYLTERIGDETIKLDSAVVKNGKFTFTGRQDSAKYCWLDLHTPERMHSCGDLFLENGNITAILGTPDEYPVTGTPNNDIYQAYKDVVLGTNKALFEYTRSRASLEDTQETRDKLHKEWGQKRVEALENILNNHLNTAVGLHFFINYKLSKEKRLELIPKLSDELVRNPKVQKIIKETKE